MHPNCDNSEAVRRDSTLIADLEEFHLRIMHRLILKLLQPMSSGRCVSYFLLLLAATKVRGSYRKDFLCRGGEILLMLIYTLLFLRPMIDHCIESCFGQTNIVVKIAVEKFQKLAIALDYF